MDNPCGVAYSLYFTGLTGPGKMKFLLNYICVEITLYLVHEA